MKTFVAACAALARCAPMWVGLVVLMGASPVQAGQGDPWYYASYGRAQGNCEQLWTADSPEAAFNAYAACINAQTWSGVAFHQWTLQSCTLNQQPGVNQWGTATCHYLNEARSVDGNYGSSYADEGFVQCPTNRRFRVYQSANGPDGTCTGYIDRYFDDPKDPKKCQRLGNPILPLTGAKTEPVSLGATLAGREFSLRYDSRTKIPSQGDVPTWLSPGAPSFGALWQSNLHRRLFFQSRTYTTTPGSQTTAAAMQRGSGEWATFPINSAGQYVATVDPLDALAPVGNGWRLKSGRDLSEEDYDSTGALTKLSFAQGGSLTFTYSTSSTPASVAPVAGLLITITDQFGRALNMTYQSLNLRGAAPVIATMTDPAGRVTSFSYDAKGNLASITWPDQRVRSFAYERSDLPWALTGVTDENTARYATFAYDNFGRATGTQHAGGADAYSVSWSGSLPAWNIVETYDPALDVIWRDHYRVVPSSVSYVDPAGQTRSLGAGTAANSPVVTSQSQPAGSGCSAAVKQRTWDAQGNLASEDDFNGQRTCYAYDTARKLETARVEGLPNTADCASVLASGATLPAGARKVSTAWHPDWALATTVTEPGTITTNLYNGQPDPLTNTTVTCAPGTTLLPDGKPLAVLCKTARQATTDANGSSGSSMSYGITSPDPYAASVVLQLRMDGSNGGTSFVDSSPANRTPIVIAPVVTDTGVKQSGTASANFTGGYLQYANSADFDMAGGDFTIEAWLNFSSASAGQRVYYLGKASSNGGGGTVTMGRTTDGKLNFVWTTTGGTSSIVDTAAVPVSTWVHVALQRNGGTMTAFKNGAPISSASVSGSFIANSNRLGIGVLGEYAGQYGTSYGTQMMGWIDDLRITKGVARYVAANVVDPTVPARVNQWTYNQYGQVLTAKDPLNNTTTYAYYADTSFTGTDPNAVGHTIGDLQTATDALGHVTQYQSYDKAGRLKQSTDANGVVSTYAYDARGRLTNSTVAGKSTSYDYWPTGLLKKVTFPDASYVSYAYDDAHRLTDVTDNLGNTTHYTLDNAGNRTGEDTKDTSGALKQQLTRAMDALNRVQQTTGRE